MPAPRPRSGPFILVLSLMALLLAPEGWAAAEDVAARAKALIDGGRAAEAVPLLENAAVADPDNARLVFLLGVAYQRAGKTREALAALNHAAGMAPEDGLVRYNLGAVRFALGDFDGAAEAFLAVPSRAPEAAPAAYLNAGLARLKAGRTDDARELLGRAIEADPESGAARSARAVLARLEPARPAPAGGPPPRPTAAFYVGREYDSNVFALPDDGTTADLSDWRSTVRGEVEVRLALSDRFRVTPHYEFYGYWYNSETAYNFRRHRVYLRLDDGEGALRPRLTWGFDFSFLGADAYTASHWLEGRLTVRRAPGRRVWVRLGVAVDEAPGQQYDYLSGTTWEAAVSSWRTAFGGGWVLVALEGRHRDRGTHVLATETISASYDAIEPYVRAQHDLPWGMEVTGQLRYEARRYAEPDTWDGPPAGAKRRVDNKATAGLTLSRPLARGLKLTLAATAQVRRSNIGNQPGNPRDRDYHRQRFGVFLEGEL